MGCTLYGTASNGSLFWFLKISNDSKWSEYVFSIRDNHFEGPLGLLVYMFRRAAIMSPAHSKESSRQTHTQDESSETTKAMGAIEDLVMEEV
ncbi:unnamed protein product [Penicillium glandicola]